MRARASVKPSRPASALGLAVGIGMALFSLPVLPQMGSFGVLWLATVLGIAGYNAWNLFSQSGVATEVVDFETSPGAGLAAGLGSASDGLAPEQRLARLDDMRARGLVDEREYAEQRQRILNSL